MRYSNKPTEPVSAYFRTHPNLGRILALIVLVLALGVCWAVGFVVEREAGNKHNYIGVPMSEEVIEKEFSYLAPNELDWTTESAEYKDIDLSSAEAPLEIHEGGDYRLKGKLNGQIHINAPDQIVHLYLDGTEITSKSGPAVWCEDAAKLIITLAEGSVNTIADSGDYRKYIDEEGSIYSVCDMTINGSGTLNVFGYYKDAIRSKDIVKILDGTYDIRCKRTAVQGNDGVMVSGGQFDISSEKNGFKTTKEGPDGRGSLIIGGGTMSIIAGRSAFVTTKASVYIFNCSIKSHSVVSTYDIGGLHKVQEGCLDER